ncbi:hypothetical protein, partial [uncultured Lamprocystis sp.]|uniref:hypothetical protein n=1 Tax=uncultured Lamprocystis sp. TaxID=543132 RepID=UPI0025DE0A62
SVTSNAAAARPAPSRRDAAPTGSLRDFHGKALDSSRLAGTMTKAPPTDATVCVHAPRNKP